MKTQRTVAGAAARSRINVLLLVVLVALAAALLAFGGVTVGATLSVPTTDSPLTVSAETLQQDTASSVVPNGVFVGDRDEAQNGLRCPGIEAADGSPRLVNDRVRDNYEYTATVEETSLTAWPAGRRYQVEVYGDGSKVAQLFLTNAVADDAKKEGVQVYVNLGSATSFPASFTTIARLITTCPSVTRAVSIPGTSFSPSSITINAGDKITWTNNSSQTHTTTSDTGIWNSGNLTPGQTFTWPFNTTGTYPYRCNIHSGQTGSVTVVNP